MREETHLDVEVDQLLGLYSEHGNPIVLAAYVVHVVGGILEAGDETSEVGLFGPADLPELAFPNDGRFPERNQVIGLGHRPLFRS